MYFVESIKIYEVTRNSMLAKTVFNPFMHDVEKWPNIL